VDRCHLMTRWRVVASLLAAGGLAATQCAAAAEPLERPQVPGRAAEALRVPEWLPKAPVPKPVGSLVRVSSVSELIRAVDSVRPGTTILLADGTYELPAGLILREDGLALRGERGDRDRVILDGSKCRDKYIIMVKGADDVLIADLTIRNGREDGIEIKGEMDTQRTRIYNCAFRNLWVRSIKGGAPLEVRKGQSDPSSQPGLWKTRPTGGSIRYCAFLQDGRKRLDDWTGGDYVGGIDLMWLKDWVIADNVFIGIRGRKGDGRGAIFVWQHSEKVVVERNLIVNCDAGICFGNNWGPSFHVTGGIIRNNFIVGGTSTPLEICKTADVLVCNNTVWATDTTTPTVHFHQTMRGGRLFNNLVHGRMKVDESVRQSGNVVGDLRGYFVGPLKGDLHLTAAATRALGKSRPLAEVGEDLDREKRTPAPDVGADEMGPGSPLSAQPAGNRVLGP